MHNSTAEDGKQNHTTELVILRNQDSKETDLEVAEIVTGTASMSPMSRPEERGMSPDNVFDASDKPFEIENYGPNEPTLPAVNKLGLTPYLKTDCHWWQDSLRGGGRIFLKSLVGDSKRGKKFSKCHNIF